MANEDQIYINDKLTVPRAEVQFRFSTSSGPGGQHANRSETRVTLLFDVAGSPSLDDEVRSLLLQKLANRLNKEGVLLIDVQTHRSQWKNRETAVALFQSLLSKALRRPKRRRKTRPGREAQQERLDEKKKRGTLKRERGQEWGKET